MTPEEVAAKHCKNGHVPAQCQMLADLRLLAAPSPYVRGIKVAPEGAKCSCCWGFLTDDDRKGSSSYATVEVYNASVGVLHSIVLWLCPDCAKGAVLATGSPVGTVILNDAVEGAVRTLKRLSGELMP